MGNTGGKTSRQRDGDAAMTTGGHSLNRGRGGFTEGGGVKTKTFGHRQGGGGGGGAAQRVGGLFGKNEAPRKNRR